MDFEANQKISSQLSFCIILVLSFLVAWYTVSAGEEVVRTAKQSEAFNIETRMRMQEIQASKAKLKSAPIQIENNK